MLVIAHVIFLRNYTKICLHSSPQIRHLAACKRNEEVIGETVKMQTSEFHTEKNSH